MKQTNHNITMMFDYVFSTHPHKRNIVVIQVCLLYFTVLIVIVIVVDTIPCLVACI